MYWPELPLVAVLQFQEGPGILAEDFHEDGIPLIRLAGIKSQHSLLEGCNYLDPSKVEARWNHFKIEVGDVLLSTSASLGEVAIATEEACGAIPYTGIIRFQPKAGKMHPEFVKYYFKSSHFAAQIAKAGVGSVMKHFGPSHLKRMNALVPPLPEQQAIAEVLGALDDKIAANRALVATADELARSLTTEALAHSSIASLDRLSSVTMGSSPKGTSYNDAGVGEVLFQGMRDFSTRFPTPRVWTSEPVRMAASGDLLMSVRAPVGALNIADRTCCIGRGLAALHTEWPAALFHLLKGQPELFASFNSDGTIFGSINKAQLNALPVKIPSNGLRKLEAQLSPLEAAITSALGEVEVLSSMRDTLLPALMDGTIRVKDAIATAEEVL